MRKTILSIFLFLLLISIVNAAAVGEDCSPIGTRDGALYCDLTGWAQQKPTGSDCDNSYECTTNICQLSTCLSGNIYNILLQGFTDLQTTQPDTTSSSGGGGSSSGGGGGVSSGSGSYLSSQSSGGALCLESWQCSPYSACIGGYKTRTCTDSSDCNNQNPYYPKPAERMLCIIPGISLPAPEPTCFDQVQNQGEEDIDCGGPCIPCTVEEASKSKSFWIIFGTIMLMVVLGLVVYWYFTFRKDEKAAEKEIDYIEHHKNKFKL